MAIGYLIGINWDYPEVLPEMSPWSSFMNTLNGSGTLADEAQKMPTARVSISSQYPSLLMPWRTFTSDYGAMQWEWVREDLMNLATDAYWYYSGHWDWQLQANAWRWQDMWYALAWIPGDWQYFTGTPSLDQSDGIVAWASSDYPQGTRVRLLPCSTLCIYHVAQLDPVPNHDDDAFRVLVSDAVRQDLGIQDPPPPPPPLAVSMSGPGGGAPFEWVTVTATVSNYVAPVTYQWTVNGSPACGNESSCTAQLGGEGTYTDFAVTVTDARPATAYGYYTVFVYCVSPVCQESPRRPSAMTQRVTNGRPGGTLVTPGGVRVKLPVPSPRGQNQSPGVVRRQR